MKTNATTSLEGVKQLTYFRIYKTNPSEQHGTIKLFSNGNQQCPIKVGLVAADADANPITLEQSDVEDALKLIHYDGGATLGDGDGYAISFDKNTFTWTEAVIPSIPTQSGTTESSAALDDPSVPNVQIYTIYVTASAGSSGVAVAARFDVTSSLLFTTNSPVDDPDGQGQDGQFNSSVETLLADPPFLSATDFGASANGVVAGRKVGNSNYFYWATEYYLEPKFNGRALPLHSVGNSDLISPAFGVYTHGDFFGNVKWGISYYSQPGSKEADPNSMGVHPLYAVDVAATRSGTPGHGGISTVTTTLQSSAEVDSVTTTVRFGSRDAGAATPGTPQAQYRPHTMYTNCVGSILGANANRVVIGVLKGNLDGQFKNMEGRTLADAPSTTLRIVDAYGNNHDLSLSYDAIVDELTIG